MSLSRSGYAIAALGGLVASGIGLAGVAAAAPTVPSAVSSAPSSADPAPAPPPVSDVPVPFVFRPVDTEGAFFGEQVPVARKLPSIAVTSLPATADTDPDDPDDPAAEADD